MDQYRNERRRHPGDHPAHKMHHRHDYDRSEEENYGNMAGSLSYGIDEAYGPSQADYERYGYLSEEENYAHHHGNRFEDQKYPDKRGPKYNQNQYYEPHYHGGHSYSPGYDALGQAYGWEERHHHERYHEPESRYRHQERPQRNLQNRTGRPDYSKDSHYEGPYRSHNLGAHDYDNYHLSRRGERSHHGRYTNPGEYYWY